MLFYMGSKQRIRVVDEVTGGSRETNQVQARGSEE